MARAKTEIERSEIDDPQRTLIHNPPEGRRRIGAEEDWRRGRAEERYARTRKRMQEEKMETKWGIVAGEVGKCLRDFRWESCMEVPRVMQCTREDKALVVAVQGIVVEDGRDSLGFPCTSSSLATRMHGCFELEWL